MRDNNKILLSGKILDSLVLDHELFGEKFYRTYCGCYRTSGYRDNVPVIISERLLDELPITTGTFMKIEGQIRTHNTLKDNKSITDMYVFATDIKTPTTEEHSNETKLVGYVCRKAEYRETTGGRYVADLILAVNRPYGKSDYIPIILWGRNAKFARNISIGEMLDVEGRFQSRVYTKRFDDGTSLARIALEVSVSKLEKVEGVDK